MPESIANLMFLALAVGATAIAAVFDMRTRRIPNWLNGSAILVGLAAHLCLQGISGASWALLAGLTGGFVFFVFYLAGGMGAGDVKLMAALGVIAGFHGLLPIMTMSAILGGVMAIALAVVRGKFKQTMANVGLLAMHHRLAGLTPHPQLNVENQETLRLPYALPMFFGCTITLFSTLITGQH